jgi:hypothetical protein
MVAFQPLIREPTIQLVQTEYEGINALFIYDKNFNISFFYIDAFLGIETLFL